MAGLSPERQQALLRMQDFYRQSGDVFSKAELERLRFVRWLYRTDRLEV
jgi:hypothetical protein